MRLLNTKQIMPGGWRLVQNDARGRFLKKFTSFQPWPMFCDEVLDFRKANKLPRATSEEVDEDAQDFMCKEVGGDPRYCIDENVKKKYESGPGRMLLAAKHVVGGLKRLGSGMGVLADWIGHGLNPVNAATAQHRSDICTGRTTGNPCKNNRDDAFMSSITAPTADFIRQQMEQKAELKLRVEGEEKLKTCSTCLCDLKLKVWTPAKTIVDRTPDSMFEKFKSEAPANCWMLALTNSTK